MVAVEEVMDGCYEEMVYNCRVADYHTYFVSGGEWGFSVWAHNAYSPADLKKYKGKVKWVKERASMSKEAAINRYPKHYCNRGGAMRRILIQIIMELFAALESAPEEIVDPDWAIETVENMFFCLRKLKGTNLKRVKAIAEEIASACQSKEGHSLRTQLLLSFCEQVNDEP